MKWLVNAFFSFTQGADSGRLEQRFNQFFKIKKQFNEAFKIVGRDISRFKNYHEPLAVLQKLIFEIIDIFEKNRNSDGNVDLSFLNIIIETEEYPKITLREALSNMFFDIDELNEVIGSEYLKKFRPF